jgi:hypothetical protein
MMNPEFKRNLWLQFSTHRLIAMPAVIGLSILAIGAAGSIDGVRNLASAGFFILVWLWGTRAAAASVIDEIRDKTWDQQRMSALQPWAMTWGKLFGATSFSWYGGVMCLAVAVVLGLGDMVSTVRHALTLVSAGILMHAAVIALNLHTSRGGTEVSQRGGIAWVVILLGLTMFPWADANKQTPMQWWHLEIARDAFLLYSSVFFAACTVFAAWRVMSNALQVRTTPWAWPLFTLLLTGYISGFGELAQADHFFRIGVFVSAGMTYAALFSEPNGIPVWQRVMLRMKRGEWRGMLEHLPIWVTTLLLTFVFAMIGVAHNAGAALTSSPADLADFDGLLPTIALAALRDSCILLFFAFGSKTKRIEGTTILYLAIIYGLLPFLAGAMHLDAVKYFLLPVSPPHLAWSTAIMTLHAAVALTLVLWRWRKQTGHEH